jgi:hypothetical protein
LAWSGWLETLKMANLIRNEIAEWNREAKAPALSCINTPLAYRVDVSDSVPEVNSEYSEKSFEVRTSYATSLNYTCLSSQESNFSMRLPVTPAIHQPGIARVAE